MASPNFTHVYSALVAVINTKLPEIINLLIKRVILQFQKAYKRNNKVILIENIYYCFFHCNLFLKIDCLYGHHQDVRSFNKPTSFK